MEHKAEGHRAVRGAVVTSAWTLLSRVLGYVRDALMAAVVGMSPGFGAFALAWTVPNLFRRLFGEGAVSAAVQPALARAEKEASHEVARGLYASVHGTLILLLLGTLAIGEIVVLSWRSALPADADNFEARRTLLYTAWLLPYVVPICLCALAAAPQNLTGRFVRPAFAPVLLNLVWILVLIGALAPESAVDAEARGTRVLEMLLPAVVLGGFLQWALQFGGVRKSDYPLLPRFGRPDPRLRAALMTFAPALLGLAAMQLNVALDQLLIRALVDPSANTYAFLANRLLHLPLALVGIAAVTGAMPMFARLAIENRTDELSEALRRGCESTLLLMLAAGAGLWVTAEGVIQVLYENGRFTSEDTAILLPTLHAYLFCLPAAALIGMLTRVHQALGNYRGPAISAALSVPINLGLNVYLLPKYGVPAAGWATASALSLQVILLLVALPKMGLRQPLHGNKLLRVPVPALATAAVAYAVTQVLDPGTIIGLIVAVGAGVLAAVAATAVVLPKDFRDLLNALRRRVPRA